MNQVRAGFRVAIFQDDMPIGDMMGRIACREAGAVFEDFDQGKLPNTMVEYIRQKMLGINRSRLRIYRPHTFCVRTIRAALIEEKRHGGIDIAYIDVFQRLREERSGSIAEDLTEQSKQLRSLSNEMAIPIVALAHMNRDADVSRRPNSGQFKYCDQLFSDCDTAVLMWSEEDPKELVNRVTGAQTRQEVRLVIDKNRGGYVGEEKVYFDRPRMRFHESRVT